MKSHSNSLIVYKVRMPCLLIIIINKQLDCLIAFGFGGLWRFAGPFSKSESNLDNAELFVNCLEAMVETCLSVEDNEVHEFEYPCTLSVSSTMNLSSSMSSLTLGSPNDKEFSTCESLKNVSTASYNTLTMGTNEGKRNSVSQNSIPKQRSLKYKSSKK